MISVEEARNIVNSQVLDGGVESVDVYTALGRVLATDVLADRDFPPFDRVTMDGIALSFDSLAQGQTQFEVSHTQYAGQVCTSLIDQKYCVEIMTGAILTKGCDVVIRYEDVEFVNEGDKKFAIVKDDKTFQWKNVHRQGFDEKKGNQIIAKGTKIDAGVIALLATVGQSIVKVKKMPKVAVISTGDELVEVDQQPQVHQIRKSNVVSIAAALSDLGIVPKLFHLGDELAELRVRIGELLKEYDVLLLSGGVSMGKADFLPQVLAENGVEKLFHKVAQRPGKPFWFGKNEEQKVVFAFPGNPISTLMCFYVYCMPWIKKQIGLTIDQLTGQLSEEVSFKPNLGYFLQVDAQFKDHGYHAIPQPGKGSGDLVNLAHSNAFMYLPAGKEVYQQGDYFELISFK
ncbi:MAG: molybdopterin molybdotransferase MoeA [Reichenbachiella sp.]